MRTSARSNLWKWPIALLCVVVVGVIVMRSRHKGVNATTVEAVPQSESVPVRAQPVKATAQTACMLIDGKRIDFPPAKLRVEKIDDKVVAVLSSQKSGDTSTENHGNSFYLQMPLEAEEPKDFTDFDWQFSVPASEISDSPYGIFLNDNQQQLQPANVKVTFDKAAPGITLVSISGDFLLTQMQDPTAPPKLVKVLAEVEAATTMKE